MKLVKVNEKDLREKAERKEKTFAKKSKIESDYIIRKTI